MRRKKGREQEQESPATGDPRISPADVQGVEFKLAFRGYSERDVDAFLDRITEDLSWYVEENARLRQGLPTAAAPTGDEVGRSAALAAASKEAAAIIRRAEQDAASIRAAAGSGRTGDARIAVAPFLNKEREFLQSLGSLVQAHAEETKQMVLAIRARSEVAATVGQVAGPTVESEASVPDRSIETDLGDDDAAPREPAPFEPATTAEMRERMGAEPALTVPESGSSSDAEPDPIVVDPATEPVFSTEGSPGSSPAGDRRERSLRELFWGED